MADNIMHTGALRFRVLGAGELELKLYALSEDPTVDAPPEQTLRALTMATATPQLRDILANFSHQYVQLEFTIDTMDEYFTISKITFYQKELYSSFPLR